MLRFIQPNGNEVDTSFLVKSTETQDFIVKLKGAKMGPATILNYIKNMIRFVRYLKTQLHLTAADPDFHGKCQTYMELLNAAGFCILIKALIPLFFSLSCYFSTVVLETQLEVSSKTPETTEQELRFH